MRVAALAISCRPRLPWRNSVAGSQNDGRRWNRNPILESNAPAFSIHPLSLLADDYFIACLISKSPNAKFPPAVTICDLVASLSRGFGQAKPHVIIAIARDCLKIDLEP